VRAMLGVSFYSTLAEIKFILAGDLIEATSDAGSRPHVRLRAGRPVSQYAGREGCAG
jgi:hypothetical protein